MILNKIFKMTNGTHSLMARDINDNHVRQIMFVQMLERDANHANHGVFQQSTQYRGTVAVERGAQNLLQNLLLCIY